MSNYSEESILFLKNLEDKQGGKITFKTYCTWFSDLKNTRQFGVFLYLIDNKTFYYEDFEHYNTFLGFKLKSKKDEKPYVKLEGSFELSSIKNIRRVSKAATLRYLTGRRTTIPNCNLFEKLFTQLLTLIELDDNRTIVVELVDHKQFINLVKTNWQELANTLFSLCSLNIPL